MTNIHTETFGQGKPIVLVHGWAMHSGIWRAFAKGLAKHYQVTLVDLPGHGRSGAIKPFTLETVSTALVGAIPNEPCCWLGWSLGAAFVLEIARRFPSRVNKVTLLAGTPCFVKNDAWSGMDVTVLDKFAESLQQDVHTTLLRFLSLHIKGLDNQKATLQELKTLVFETPEPSQHTLQQGLDILKQADLRDVFANLKIPVAVILGRLDTLIPVSVGVKMHELLPDVALTVIDRAGHVPFLSHQEALVNAVRRFMDKG
ncbi:pimelyl-[acyl-carrier protein] methyl ester esterase BioH [Methyloglobulus morosus KoM1]|uniref:Pimeloyl-[acyl-carrier protein] methyl ester esterase n=1 Tax=Methyloglobulus morosus KoM1 TaxID=1116472 RepID=V5C6D1_9GAMM|nr:pimeloyl-ACP methyl ester esterase BioH [Methyloglobulus morosus]ESS72313.1 pimelyl-[acyl-carrier protein] methyl ester esterase BioH [Methyloglobulus morosus KoM1]